MTRAVPREEQCWAGGQGGQQRHQACVQGGECQQQSQKLTSGCVALFIKPVRRQRRSLCPGEGGQEGGISTDATWACHIPARKTKHLCDDGRAAGKQPRDETQLTP